MEKSSFEIVCELIRVCESYDYSFTLESNVEGSYRLIIRFSLSRDAGQRYCLMAGSFAYAVLKVADSYSNVSSCFNAESASLNISVWNSTLDDCEK